MAADDDAVVTYLRQYSQDLLDGNALGSIKKRVIGRNMTEMQFLNAVRREMLANKMMGITNFGTFTPTSAWEYHMRTKRRVKAELIRLQVEDFVAQVKQKPSNRDLKDLFERHKGELPFPYSSTPGFKRRKTVAVAYVKADFNTYLEAEKAKITDAEVAAYYEENKEQYRKAELPAESPFSQFPADKSDDLTPEDEQPTGDKPAEEKPADDPETEEKQDEENPADEPVTEEKPGEEKPGE